jgi:hypothetical protein
MVVLVTEQRQPGVSREQRVSDEGLKRLEEQLRSGRKMSTPVLRQWIIRYGDSARDIIKRHGCYTAALDT